MKNPTSWWSSVFWGPDWHDAGEVSVGASGVTFKGDRTLEIPLSDIESLRMDTALVAKRYAILRYRAADGTRKEVWLSAVWSARRNRRLRDAIAAQLAAHP